MTLDDLELELRKLPGVRAAGFDDRDDVLMVQLHVATEAVPTDLEVPLPIAATRIAARHSDRPVAVEVIRWRDAPALAETAVPASAPATVTPIGAAPQPAPVAAHHGDDAARPRLLAVLSFPDTDELEVHLVLAGRRAIGRAAASRGLIAAVEATVEAIRTLDVALVCTPLWARPIESAVDGVVLVATALDAGPELKLYGFAAGSSAIEAAARAALDALNRQLSRLLA